MVEFDRKLRASCHVSVTHAHMAATW